jgi:phosphoribosyl-dephospho-CoA transferase
MQAPHDLLRLRDPRDLVHRVPTPPWVCEALLLAPWVVVRRAPFENELIPVGVRGRNRNERFAAFVRAESIVQCAKPEGFASGQSWRTAPRGEELPAMRALPPIHATLRKLDLAWGPIGSVGFELASGFPAANFDSDLDLLIRVEDTVIPRPMAEDLVGFMEGVGVRVDVQLETTAGAIALAEYARSVPELLLRTLNGPRLIRHPGSLHRSQIFRDL